MGLNKKELAELKSDLKAKYNAKSKAKKKQESKKIEKEEEEYDSDEIEIVGKQMGLNRKEI